MLDLTGRTLGQYRVVDRIGAGGMGEVYRSRDTRLERDVAIKVLPDELARNPERLARFEREAKVLASLNHQNIATLYGLEEHEGERYLVMELAEGETLGARIRRGPLPVDEAVDLACQIARGLEAAHRQGIIHRDLKPSNVMVTPDGMVKILDFGLARMWVDEVSDPDQSRSPTITAQLTAQGVLLGTAAYMSPEQARGQPVDKQSDIWSFGVVLYEMLTGSNPLVADTAGETIGNVHHKEIGFERLPRLPASVRRTVRRCLERKLERRYRDIGDVCLELEQRDQEEAPAPAEEPRAAGSWYWIVAAVVLIAAAAGLGWMTRGRGQSTAVPILEADISLPEGHRLSALTLPNFALSRDGRQLAFFTGREPSWGSPTQLVLRRLDQAEGVPVAGVEGGTTPVFSPDGRWIAYVDNAVYKVPAGGGQRVRINTEGDLNRGTVIGLSWGVDGDLVIGMRSGGLQLVSAQGGEPTALTELDEGLGEFRHCLPDHLPDGRTVLFTAFRHHLRNPEPSSVSVWALRLDSGERVWLADDASQARYSSDQLLFMRNGDLMAAPFDVSRLELTGSPRVLESGVLHARHMGDTAFETGVGHYDVDAQGTLVHTTAGVFRDLPNTVVWVDRSGGSTPADVESGVYFSVRVSPDGSSLLLWKDNPSSVWVHDLKRGATRRELEGETKTYSWFAWGPGPDRITGTRFTETGTEMLTARIGADSGQTSVLPFSRPGIFVSEWSRDGQVLVGATSFGGDGSLAKHAIWMCRRDDGCRQMPKRPDVSESHPALSPDGRWLAFTSDESARREVYLRSTTDLGAVLQVSFRGGECPLWSRDGSELFFCSNDRPPNFYAVAIEADTENGLKIGEPERLFTLDVGFTNPVRSWDVAPDGRFVFIMLPAREVTSAFYEKRYPDRIHILQSWPAKLEP
jgi:serine/threonine-protein kinase